MAIHISLLSTAVSKLLTEYSKGIRASQVAKDCGVQVLSTETDMTISGEVFFDGEDLVVQTAETTNAEGKTIDVTPKKVSRTARRSYKQEAQESGTSNATSGIERSIQNQNEII